MSDLDMLKAIVDRTAAEAEPGGRFDAAEEAVRNVLHLLYGTTTPDWQEAYDAIKSAYVGEADWGDDA